VPETLNIVAGNAAMGFDPLNSLTGPVMQIAYFTSGRLMDLSPEGDAGVFELAEALEESEDRMSWTATLRSGLKFSDGSPITGADVVASFEYAQANSGPTGKFAIYDVIDKVVASSDTEIVFHVKQPNSLIPYLLADTGSTIYPASGLAQGDSFFLKPISAGPYKMDAFDEVSGKTELSVNENYWGTAPKIKKIVYTVVADSTTRLAQLTSGGAQIALDFPPAMYSQITGDVRALESPSFGAANWFVFSDESPITGDKKVRHALNLAIDREQIISVANGGLGSPNNGIPWVQEDLLSSQTPIKRNVDEAKKLLVGTPCESGCTLRVLQPVSDAQPTNQIALVLQQQLKEIGIDMQIMNTPGAQIVEALQKPGTFDAYNSAAAVGNPAPATIALMEVDPAADIFSSYELHYTSPKMGELVKQIVSAPAEETPAIAAQINALFEEDLPYLSMIATPQLFASTLADSVVTVTYDGRLILP